LLRTGTVDDFRLHETKLRPTQELFVGERVDWLKEVDGLQQIEGLPARPAA